MRPRADTVLLWTGATCINGCAACPIDASTAPPGVQMADLRRELAAVSNGLGRLAVLIGGEPLLRADVFRLIAAVRARGFAPGIVTTGRPLVYPHVRQRLRDAGLAYLRVQLFGAGDRHDRATAVPGAFEQTIGGLRAWIAERRGECDVDVALTVRGQPIETLAGDVDEVARAIDSPDVHLVIAVDPAAYRTHPGPLRQALTALARWNDDEVRPLLAWEGLPEPPFDMSTLAIAPLRPAFVGAAALASCTGAADAFERAQSMERHTAQANSFNFVCTETAVPWSATADACTADRAGAGVDPHRSLWLVEGDQLVLHATDTGDFTAAAIARIKDEYSHLFLDRSPAGVLDDFTEGMRRVRVDPVCGTCSRRDRCARRYVVVDGPPFAREEAWIAGHVAALRGRVLDVGCGEQLYRDVLAPLLRAGTVRYTGLDPDEPSLASARAALPEGRFFLGGIEQYRGERASYDHILCLRSLNHVVDLDESVARMAELLAPGGSLLIVETTPFAMLRRPEQVAAADRAPRAGHQHFRNVASEDVLPYARRRGLRVVEQHRASLENTNEWILLLQR